MNKIFRVIWNHSTQSWIAVSELSKAKGKVASSQDKRISLGKLGSAIIIGGISVGNAFAAQADTPVRVDNSLSNLYISTGSDTNSYLTQKLAIRIGDGRTVRQESIVIGNNIRDQSTGDAGDTIIGNRVQIGGGGGDSFSTAVGYKTVVAGPSVAMGVGASADNFYGEWTSPFSGAIAIGAFSQSGGNVDGQVSIGSLAESSSGNYGVALGTLAGVFSASNKGYLSPFTRAKYSPMSKAIITAEGNAAQSVSIGYLASGRSNNSVAIGDRATTGVFLDSKSNANASVAVGNNARALRTSSVAIGDNAIAGGYTDAEVVKIQALLVNMTTAVTDAQADVDTAKADLQATTEAKDKAEKKYIVANAVALLERAKAVKARLEKDLDDKMKTTGTSAKAAVAVGLNTRATNENAIAIGNASAALGVSAIAIGTANIVRGDKSGAIGDPTYIDGTGSYSLGNDNVISNTANNSSVVGSNNKLAGTATTNGVITAAGKANDSFVVGNNNTVKSDKVMILGNNIVTDEKREGGVILGDNSTADVVVKKVNAATVNGITYTGFAGNLGGAGDAEPAEDAKQGRFVSVGKASEERQIKHVAAGEISADSTDAINGSQLYLTQEALGNVAKSTATNLGGGVAVNPNGTLTAPSYEIKLGNTSPITGGNSDVNYGTPATNVGDAITALNKYINEGFRIADNDNATKGIVTPTETVQFVNGQGTTSNVTLEKGGITKVTFDVKTGEVVKSNEGTATVNGQPVEVVNVDGNYYNKGDIDPTTGKPKDGVTAVTPDADTVVENKGAGLVTGNQVADAIQKSGWTVGKSTVETLPEAFDNADEKVNPDDNVRFADGLNTKVSLGTVKELNADGSVQTTTTVKVDVVGLPVQYTAVVDGKEVPVAKAADGKFYPVDENGNPITKNADGSPADEIPANNIATNVINPGAKPNEIGSPITLGNIEGNLPGAKKGTDAPTDAGELPTGDDAPKLNNAATVGDVLNAGWNLQGNGKAVDFVKPYETVNFVDGTGTTVETSTDGSTSVIKVNTVMQYTDADGNPVKKVGDNYYPADSVVDKDGNVYPAGTVLNQDGSAPAGAAKQEPVANPQISLVNGDKTSTTPTVLGNLAQGANTFADKGSDANTPLVKVGDKYYAPDQFENGKLKADAQPTDLANGVDLTNPADVAKGGLADLNNSNPTNAMTIADARNLGWIVSAGTPDKADYADDVRNANEVRFIGKGLASVTGVTNATTGVREITVDVKTGEVVKSNEGTATVNGQPVEVVNVDGNYYNKGDIDPTTGKPKDGVTAVTPDADTVVENKGAGLVTGNQVADAIQKSGWTVGKSTVETLPEAFDNADEKVNPDDNVRFADGLNTKVSLGTVKELNADGSVQTTTTVKVDVVGLPVQYTAVVDGKEVPVAKAADGKFYPVDENGNPITKNADGSPADEIPANNIATNVINPGAKPNEIGSPITLGNIEGNLPGAKKGTDAPTDAGELPTGDDAPKLNNAATVGDVLNAGWNLQGNGKAVDFVKPYETVNFVDGTGTTVETSTDGSTSVIKVNTVMQYTDADGNPVKKVGDNYYPADSVVDKDGNVYPAGTVLNQDGSAPAGAAKQEPVANPQISLVNGDKTSTTPTVLGNLAQGANTFADKGSDANTPLVKVGDKYYAPDQFENGKLKADAQPTDLANGVDLTNPADVAKGGLADLNNSNPTNAMTIADARNLGWIVSAGTPDKADYADDVRNANEVRFIGKGLATVTGVTNATTGVREITVDVKTGEVMPTNADNPVFKADDGTEIPVVKIGDQYFKKADLDPTTGLPTEVAKPLTPDEANKVENKGGKGTGLVTGNQVGDAIQKSGWNVGKATDIELSKTTFSEEAKNIEKVNPNDNVRFANGKGTVVKAGIFESSDENGVVTTTTTFKVDVDLPIEYNAVDTAGNPLVKANDGKWYPAEQVDAETGRLKDPATAEAKEPATIGAKLTMNTPAEKEYTVEDPIEKAVEAFKKENPNATPEEIAAAKEKAIIANPALKDTPVAGTGGVNLDNVAWATKPDQAVNKDQLDQTVNKSGFFVKQNGSSTEASNLGKTKDVETEKVTPNDVVDFIDGNNTRVSASTKREEGRDVTQVQVNVVGLPVTYTTADGTPVTKVGDKFYTVNELGEPTDVEVAADKLSINMVDPTAKPNSIGKPQKLANVADGDISPNSTEAVNGSQLYAIAGDYIVINPETGKPTLKSDTFKDLSPANGGSTTVDGKPFTAQPSNVVDAVNTVNKEGTKYFKSNSTEPAAKAEGKNSLALGAGAEAKPEGSIAMGKGSSVKADAPKGSVALGEDSVAGKPNVGDYSTHGRAVAGKTGSDTKVLSVGKPGDERQIQNVAPGVISATSTDAVNGSQLHDVIQNVNQKFGDVHNKIDRNNKDLRAGVAGANAAAGLPQVYIPGKSMVAAAAGTFKGQSAVAVGYSRASDNGKLILKLQGNANTRGDVGGSVGVGYQW